MFVSARTVSSVPCGPQKAYAELMRPSEEPPLGQRTWTMRSRGKESIEIVFPCGSARRDENRRGGGGVGRGRGGPPHGRFLASEWFSSEKPRTPPGVHCHDRSRRDGLIRSVPGHPSCPTLSLGGSGVCSVQGLLGEA